jgi:AraC-like DNA-binding protein
MAEFILFGIVLIAIATLYIGWKKRPGALFDKVCDAYLFFVFIHALYALIVLSFFRFHQAIDMAAPFALGYGPFFYIGLKSLDQKLNKKDIYIHFASFVVFVVLYSILMMNKEYWLHYFMSYYILQYALVIIGLLGYAFWALLLYPGLKEGEYSEQKKQFVKTCSYSLAVMVFLFAVIAFSGYVSVDDLKGEVSGLIVYATILISVIMAYVFRVNNLVAAAKKDVISPVNVNTVKDEAEETEPLLSEEPKPVEEIKMIGSIPVQKYNKSALSPVVLDDYRNKLDKFINIEKVYLDNELTLEGLAKKMRMPMHHLTQLFNVYLGENFNQYINRFRVDYACQLLFDNDGSMSIEQIAFNSGFNSKVSFNRHFKNITGYSPKEYIANRKSTDI